MALQTVHKTCNLCEAMCGLRIDVRDNEVVRIEADPDDPLSLGAICPKAVGLDQIQRDPNRLRQPVRRTSSGFRAIPWEEALDETADRLAEIQRAHGNDAVGSYLGNPGAHNFGVIMSLTALYAAIQSRNRYSASSLDQNPKHASSILLYGNFLRIPVPDVDRTQFLLVMGANPLVSNGSLMTAPGFARRLRALRERGGKLVVVDPRRSETAQAADAHLFIQPGRDPLLLASMISVVLGEGLGRPSHLDRFVDGRDALESAVSPFAPEDVEADLGIDASVVRGLARDFASSQSAVCYARIGTCTSPYGTLTSWLVDVLNLMTGNLDRTGGSMFPRPAVDLPGLAEKRGGGNFGTWRTRVRNAPSFNDEQPTACLAEEILEPGPGQIRGMLTIAGNPCLSAPNGPALARAFGSLDFYAAVDFYVNETTRFADIILPPMWSLEHDNYEALFHGFAVRNTAKYSPKVIEPEPGQRDDWDILTQLAVRLAAAKRTGLARSLLRGLAGHVPASRSVLDWGLRIGPHGDHFAPWRKGLRLSDLEDRPSGIDLGPLERQLDLLLDRSKKRIDLAPRLMLDELARLRDHGARIETREDELLLIGRRDMRTNNSWFHNIALSTKGKDRCTLRMNPADAEKRSLSEGERVVVRSRVGEVVAPLEIREEMMPGVVSLPHGWGHDAPGLELDVASAHPGVSCNDLVDESVIEPVVGNAVFNGVPVSVTAGARASLPGDPS